MKYYVVKYAKRNSLVGGWLYRFYTYAENSGDARARAQVVLGREYEIMLVTEAKCEAFEPTTK